jgi:hypothetical protein
VQGLGRRRETRVKVGDRFNKSRYKVLIVVTLSVVNIGRVITIVKFAV